MKLSGRFDITNRAMGGVVVLRSRKQWCGERLTAPMLTTKSAALRFALPQPFFAEEGEFERQAGHGSLLTRRSIGSLERLRYLGDRLTEGANIVL
jgi:hypothetical protein